MQLHYLRSSFLILVLLSFATVGFALVPPDACGEVSYSIDLTKNLTATSGTCLTIRASNIVIDGHGYTILQGNPATIGYGINIIGNVDGGRRLSNVTIKNVNIVNFSTGVGIVTAENITVQDTQIQVSPIVQGNLQRRGIYVTVGKNITLQGLQVTSTGAQSTGIYISQTPQNTISEATIKMSGANSNGIVLDKSDNNTVVSSSIEITGTGSNGIYTTNTARNVIENNNIKIQGDGSGIELVVIENSTIFQNTVETYGANSIGIHIENSKNTTIQMNTISTSDGQGTFGIFGESLDFTKVIGNVISIYDNNGEGIHIDSGKNIRTLENSITTYGNNSFGIEYDELLTSIFFSNTIATHGNDALGLLLYNSPQTNISDNTITTTGINSPGILVSASNNNNLESNTITTQQQNSHGIALIHSNETILSSNDVATQENFAIGLFLNTADKTTGTENIITTAGNSSSGLHLVNATNSVFSSNVIVTTGATKSYGLVLSDSSDNTFTSDVVSAVGNELYALFATARNSIMNMTLDGVVTLSVSTLRNAMIDVVDGPAAPTGKTQIGKTLSMTPVSTGGIVEFMLQYTDADVISSNDTTTKIYINTTTAGWKALETSLLNTATDTVSSGVVNFKAPMLAGVFVDRLTCGLITKSKTLDRDLTSDGTCFTIGADNIVLDGAGYTITGTNSGVGIDNSGGFDNVSIVNFGNIQNFQTGILAAGTARSTFSNNYIQVANITDALGILLRGSSNNNSVTSNTVVTNGNNSQGIVLQTSSNNTVSGNTVTTTGAFGFGIYVYSGAMQNTIKSNTIRTYEFHGYGIRVVGVTKNTLSANTIATSGPYGYGMRISADQTTLNGNTLITTGSSAYGIALQSTSGISSFQNSVITTDAQAYGYFLENVAQSTLTQDSINASASFDLYVDNTSNKNSISNVVLEGKPAFSTQNFSAIAVSITKNPPANPAGKYNLSEYVNVTNLSTTSYVDFNINYAESDAAKVNESSIRLYYFDRESQSWVIVSTSFVNTTQNTVSSGNLSFFALFAPFGNATPTETFNYCTVDADCNQSSVCRQNACVPRQNATPFCGNGKCETGETEVSCPRDCIVVTTECDAGEKRCLGDSVQNCVRGTWATQELCVYGCDYQSIVCKAKPVAPPTDNTGAVANQLVWILVPIFVLAIVLGLFLWFVKKQMREEDEEFR
ncbi:MAG: right-handed parallel beta-helix repeat-containing protein [Candidatus Aenigmarchaeota archaeon]|nr:right-handed parallel beta-helix repeat-containing protein [Candidatus Aenigmarchaeota archaeon]